MYSKISNQSLKNTTKCKILILIYNGIAENS